MTAFEDETESNRSKFNTDWTTEIQKNWTTLASNKVFSESYRRIAALNAIRSHIVDKKMAPESAAFFLEAQNDALVSHVNASYGAWRSSLQSLRSCLENSMCALYYKDHPVELQRWINRDFRISFSELIAYFSKHPALKSVDANLTGLEILEGEYSTLSLAVHGSAKAFRMTGKSAEVLLWSSDAASAGMWAARERLTLQGICLLIVALFRDDLEGMKLPAVREALYYVLPQTKRDILKTKLHITISKPV